MKKTLFFCALGVSLHTDLHAASRGFHVARHIGTTVCRYVTTDVGAPGALGGVKHFSSSTPTKFFPPEIGAPIKYDAPRVSPVLKKPEIKWVAYSLRANEISAFKPSDSAETEILRISVSASNKDQFVTVELKEKDDNIQKYLKIHSLNGISTTGAGVYTSRLGADIYQFMKIFIERGWVCEGFAREICKIAKSY